MKQDKYINNKEKINYKRMPSINDMYYMIFLYKASKMQNNKIIYGTIMLSIVKILGE